MTDEFYSKYEQVARFTQLCAGEPSGAACWKALANEPECFVWNTSVVDMAETVTWSGACSLGVAHGTGTLRWTWVWNLWDQGERQYTYESSGNLEEGMQSGDWIESYPDGIVGEGPYVRGKRHGDWVFRSKDGTVSKGAYVDNLQEGYWIEYTGTGRLWEPHLAGNRNGGVGGIGTQFKETGTRFRGKREGEWTEVRKIRRENLPLHISRG